MSRLEYELLKWAQKAKFEYIVRDKDKCLCIYRNEPFKYEQKWHRGGNSSYGFMQFNDLFQFVQWEDTKPRSIGKLLQNCVVLEK